MRSVRARAAIGATLVVAVALVAAGLAVLLVLRVNLIDQADLQAEVAAREVAGQLATGTPYDELELDDEEDHPVQVTDEEGRAVVVSKDLRAITGTGTSGVTPVPSASVGASPSPGDGDDDEADEDDDRSRPGRG
ncbi:two-component sensor histidine kinase, partial [Streptomyces anulatus]